MLGSLGLGSKRPLRQSRDTLGLASSSFPAVAVWRDSVGQAMRDTYARIEAPGEAATQAQRADWHTLSWLYAEGAPVKFENMPPKQKRWASFHHTQCLDHLVRSTSNLAGLSEFLPKEGDSKRGILELPALVTNEGAGPVPTSARWFRLYHVRLREMPQRDPFHALWRVFVNCVAEAGMRGVMLVTGLEANFAQGPWRGGG